MGLGLQRLRAAWRWDVDYSLRGCASDWGEQCDSGCCGSISYAGSEDGRDSDGMEIPRSRSAWRWNQYQPQHSGSGEQSYGRDFGECRHTQCCGEERWESLGFWSQQLWAVR